MSDRDEFAALLDDDDEIEFAAAGVSSSPEVQPGSGSPDAGQGGLLSESLLSGFMVPDDWSEEYGTRAGFDPQLADALFVAVLVVPDETRFPCPVERSNFKPVDLSGLNDQTTAEQIKEWVSAALPDDQLLALRDHEMAASVAGNRPPRRVAWSKITAEINRRSPFVHEWVEQTADHCNRAQITAAAFAIGAGEPVFLVDRMNGSEIDILAEFWKRSSGRTVASFDCHWVRRLMAVRSIFHDLESRRSESTFVVSQRADDPLCDLACAYGFGNHALMSPAAVLEAHNELAFKKLQAEARKRLELSRLVLCAESTI